MKTFVFSDSHLTTKFNQRLFNKLEKLIGNADQVIINGDLWDGLIITFDEFMNSEWKRLFKLLKAKNTIYVYGNHDDVRFSDDRVYEFCKLAVPNYTLKTAKHTYFFIHGDKFLFPKQPIDAIGELHPLKERFMGYVQYWIFKLFGPNAFPESFNKMTLNERKKIVDLNYVLVCGHSHKQQYNKLLNFVDLGFFNYNWANYMIIDDVGEFRLYSEKY